MVNVVSVVNVVKVASVPNVIISSMWSVLLVLFLVLYCTLTTDPLSTTYHYLGLLLLALIQVIHSLSLLCTHSLPLLSRRPSSSAS